MQILRPDPPDLQSEVEQENLPLPLPEQSFPGCAAEGPFLIFEFAVEFQRQPAVEEQVHGEAAPAGLETDLSPDALHSG